MLFTMDNKKLFESVNFIVRCDLDNTKELHAQDMGSETETWILTKGENEFKLILKSYANPYSYGSSSTVIKNGRKLFSKDDNWVKTIFDESKK